MVSKRIFSKKCILFFMFLFLIISFKPYNVSANSVSISATTAVLIDQDTGQVLYDKKMHIKRPPASTTKILTAITAIEEADVDDIVKVSRKAAYQEGSSIYLEPGEEITLKELLYGIMLASGNDAAVAIAEHVSDSVDNFAELMNQKAREMGAQNSNFLNPNGLPQSGHYSTAYDLAVIMRYAMNNDLFAKITGTKHKTITWADHDWGRGLRNHNKMLWSYSAATGGKTGYTRAAGRCLVTSAAKGNRRLIAVVLNCPNDWMEIKRLLEYGFSNFKKVKAVRAGETIYKIPVDKSLEKELVLITEDKIDIVIPEGDKVKVKKEIIINPELDLPIKKDKKIGELVIYHENLEVGRTDLLAAHDLNFASSFLRLWHKINVYLENKLSKQEF